MKVGCHGVRALVSSLIMSQSLHIAGKTAAEQELEHSARGFSNLSKVSPVFSHMTSHLKNTFHNDQEMQD